MQIGFSSLAFLSSSSQDDAVEFSLRAIPFLQCQRHKADDGDPLRADGRTDADGRTRREGLMDGRIVADPLFLSLNASDFNVSPTGRNSSLGSRYRRRIAG